MDTTLTDKARENLMRWYEKDLEIYAYCKDLHRRFSDRLTEVQGKARKARPHAANAA